MQFYSIFRFSVPGSHVRTNEKDDLAKNLGIRARSFENRKRAVSSLSLGPRFSQQRKTVFRLLLISHTS